MKNFVIILAGGVGSRMNNSSTPKQFLCINNKPIIIYTLEHFQEHSEIDGIIISCLREWIPYMKKICNSFGLTKVINIVEGGSTGQLSIYNGLIAANKFAHERSIILIHDGVRPLITEKLITDNLKSVKKHGSSVTSAKAKETVISVNDDGIISVIPDREKSMIAKAPQGFWLEELLNIHRKAMGEKRIDFIDSCTLMNHYGKKLYIVDSPSENIKITTPDDISIVEALIKIKDSKSN